MAYTDVLATIPDQSRFQSRAAGLRRVTTFSALRHSGDAGPTVTILGIGGLGLSWVPVRKQPRLPHHHDHAAPTRRRFLKLGAHYFIDSATDDVTEASIIPAVCDPGHWQVWEVR